MKFMKVTKHLIKYKKNNSLLLLNGMTIKPILIKKGKKIVLNLLSDVNKIEREDEELFNFLLYHNIIVDDNDREDYRIRHDSGCRINAAVSRDVCAKCVNIKQRISLYILLSQGCNLGCVYCLNGEKTYKKSRYPMMKENVAYKGIERVAQTVIPGGTLEIVFFGGEPLLNWNLAKKIIIYCEEKIKKLLKIKYHLTSNLTLLPSDLIEWAKKYNISFLCNIDGYEKLHNLTRPYKNGKGSYKTTAKNIEKIRKAGLGVALRATITSRNMNYIKETAICHKELGGIGSAFVSVNAVNSDEFILSKSLLPNPDIVARGLSELVESNIWSKDKIFPFNEFIKRIKPYERNIWGCGAPHGNTPVLDINGDIYACIYLVGINRYRLGNAFSDDQYPDRKIVKEMMDIIDIDNSPECKDCKLKYMCGGACPVGRFTIQGNPTADEEVIRYTREVACKTNKAMIEEALWFHAEKLVRGKLRDNPISSCQEKK